MKRTRERVHRWALRSRVGRVERAPPIRATSCRPYHVRCKIATGIAVQVRSSESTNGLLSRSFFAGHVPSLQTIADRTYPVFAIANASRRSVSSRAITRLLPDETFAMVRYSKLSKGHFKTVHQSSIPRTIRLLSDLKSSRLFGLNPKRLSRYIARRSGKSCP